jgi:hypothetical protein
MCGIILTIAYLPFLFGMMLPGFIDRNPYAVFFSMCNFPVTFALGGVIDWLAEYIWEYPTRQNLVVSQFYVSVAFWAIFGGIVGLVKDLRGNQGG